MEDFLPQCALVRDRDTCGKTELRAFSYEWRTLSEQELGKKGEGLGKLTGGVEQA